MSLSLAPSYATLCAVQGALVAAPWRPWRLGRSWTIGAFLPLAALAVGVAASRAATGGATALADLATFGAPILAACCGFAFRWRWPWVAVLLAPALFLVAWRTSGLGAQAAGVALVAGACLTLAALVASLAPPVAIAVGLVVLALIDTALVLGDQVRPATEALHAVVPPHAALPGGVSRPLPALQDASFGTALMGWLDVFAPPLLATVLARATLPRLAAALATFVVALAWGLLLLTLREVPATVPVLAGLAVGLGLAHGLPRRRE